MSVSLYYFSATGNSLTTAKLLANELEDCKVISISSVLSQSKIIETADVVGFVFPVYYSDMPYPVRNAISKMVLKENTYVFILTTYKGHMGNVAKRMDQLLHTIGQKLSLALGVSMPGNSYISTPEFDKECLALQKERILTLAEEIKKQKTEDYSEQNVIPRSVVSYPNNFRGIMAEDTCIGCGTCVKVCPMNNIKIENKKAFIGDDCATCLACFHWCPVEAIYMSKQENIARRKKYHHPDVTVKDFFGEEKEV